MKRLAALTAAVALSAVPVVLGPAEPAAAQCTPNTCASRDLCRLFEPHPSYDVVTFSYWADGNEVYCEADHYRGDAAVDRHRYCVHVQTNGGAHWHPNDSIICDRYH